MLKSERFISGVLKFVEVPKTIKKKGKWKVGETKVICYEYFFIFTFSTINLVTKTHKGKESQLT